MMVSQVCHTIQSKKKNNLFWYGPIIAKSQKSTGLKVHKFKTKNVNICSTNEVLHRKRKWTSYSPWLATLTIFTPMTWTKEWLFPPHYGSRIHVPHNNNNYSKKKKTPKTNKGQLSETDKEWLRQNILYVIWLLLSLKKREWGARPPNNITHVMEVYWNLDLHGIMVISRPTLTGVCHQQTTPIKRGRC